jgi:hypothetical protein
MKRFEIYNGRETRIATVEAMNAFADADGRLRFYNPEAGKANSTVAGFAPGSWTHFVVVQPTNGN